MATVVSESRMIPACTDGPKRVRGRDRKDKKSGADMIHVWTEIPNDSDV